MSLPYTYVPNVPQGSQAIDATQPPINGNFQDIADLMAVNHIGFNTVDTFGKHSFVSYVNQLVDPVTSSTEMALYSKLVSGDSNLSEMFYRYPSSGAIVQLTGSPVTGQSSGGAGSGGLISAYYPTDANSSNSWGSGYYQYLSNGVLMMQWNYNNNVTTSVSPTTPFVVAIPHGSGIPSFTQTPFNLQLGGAGGNSTTLAINEFAVVATSSTTINMYYNSTNKSGIYSGTIIAIGI